MAKLNDETHVLLDGETIGSLVVQPLHVQVSKVVATISAQRPINYSLQKVAVISQIGKNMPTKVMIESCSLGIVIQLCDGMYRLPLLSSPHASMCHYRHDAVQYHPLQNTKCRCYHQ